MKPSTIILIVWSVPIVLFVAISIYATIRVCWEDRKETPRPPRPPGSRRKALRKWWDGIDWRWVGISALVIGWVFGLLGLAVYLEGQGL